MKTITKEFTVKINQDFFCNKECPQYKPEVWNNKTLTDVEYCKLFGQILYMKRRCNACSNNF